MFWHGNLIAQRVIGARAIGDTSRAADVVRSQGMTVITTEA